MTRCQAFMEFLKNIAFIKKMVNPRTHDKLSFKRLVYIAKMLYL